MNEYTVYEIRNRKTSKAYVGSTVDLGSRYSRHRRDLRNGIHRNINLQKDYDKYGEEYFEFITLEEVSTYDEAIKEEQWYMDLRREEFGVYNILPKAGSTKGRTYREETLKRMSDSAKSRGISPETRKKIADSRRGKSLSSETIEKMRKSHLDRAKGIEEWSHAKISKEGARELITRVAKGEKIKDIYEEYGVAYSTACAISRGGTWKKVFDEVMEELAEDSVPPEIKTKE